MPMMMGGDLEVDVVFGGYDFYLAFEGDSLGVLR